MQSHQIVSRQEWIAARKAHLDHEKEFTRARDRLSEERRALPWVKVDKAYLFDGPCGQGDAGGSVQGPQPAGGAAFHVRAGLERGLQELFVLGRRLRAHGPASRRARHHAGGRLPRAAVEARRVQGADGLDVRLVLLGRQRLQPRLCGLVHAGGDQVGRQGLQFRHLAASASRRRPASACSTATRKATSSTPIPASPAAST